MSDYCDALEARSHRSYLRMFVPYGLALLFSMISVTANAQVSIVLHRPPPNQLRARDLWQVDLSNTSTNNFTVYLHGTATEISDPTHPLLVVDAQTAEFVLPPGFKTVNGSDLSPIKINTSDPRYRSIATSTGQVPAGNYQVCCEVIDVATKQVLGKDCYDQTVEVLTPPILILPADESSVPDKYPIFSWLPPSPVAQGIQVRYQLKIVEVLGRQTPYDAMTSNPAWFSATNIYSNFLQYPLSARTLENGERYAWKINASSDRTSLGESEIWWFTYSPDNPGVGSSGASSGSNSGSTGSSNGQLGGGAGNSTLSGGALHDSLALYDFFFNFSTANFVIPNGSTNLDSENLSGPFVTDAAINLVDPNARSFVPNTPNDTSRGGACGREPRLRVSFEYPPMDKSASNWQQPFGIDWTVLHSEPIDHVDLRIALYGHEDAPLAHYIYRASSGSIATATTFDPHPFILNPAAPGIVCIITAVAVDVLGRSSGPVQQMYINGTFDMHPVMPAHGALGIAPLMLSTTSDSAVIVGGEHGGSHFATISPRSLTARPPGSLTFRLINRDSRPHHYQSVYTPPYLDSAPLMIGGIPPIDFGELAPGASASITVPRSAPECYVWTLYDLDTPEAGSADQLQINVSAH